MVDWKIQHKNTIDNFLAFLNERTDEFVLKGGTALLTCYGLDRFSEDIDLDGKNKNIKDYVLDFCKYYKFSYRIAKDTDTVKRIMVNYEHNKNPIKPLTIEASFRRKIIPSGEITMINGISVYQIEPLCLMKATAYAARDKIRDLYDLSYICNNFFDKLSSQTLLTVRNAIEYKGIEQYDYLVKQTKDELIDVVKLGDDFLKMYDKLGLLYDSGDKQIFDEVIQTKLADRCKKEAQQLQTPVPPHKRNDHER